MQSLKTTKKVHIGMPRSTIQGLIGTGVSVLAVIWCALSASKLFITAFNMEHQQLLVAYPCSLLYAVFALITMF